MSFVEVTAQTNSLRSAQFSPKNVLHNFNNFVQLPASDIGFHAFHEHVSMRTFDSIANRNASYRSYRGMVAGFHWVRVGCEFQLVCQPENHLNLFMEE